MRDEYAGIVGVLVPIPGLTRMLGSGYVLNLTSSTNDVVIGSVSGAVPPFSTPIDLTIHVASGVTIGSSGAGVDRAISIALSLHEDSRILIVNEGRIQGRGGSGGRSHSNSGGSIAGAGGGGAGTIVGVGGEAYSGAPAGTIGADGTATAGGAGGTGSASGGTQNVNATDGEDGGNAIVWGNHYVTIDNTNGEIWAGGGGGGGGGIAVSGTDGGAGGGPGQDGVDGDLAGSGSQPGSFGGTSGYAYFGTRAPTILGGGSSPNLEGLTSP